MGTNPETLHLIEVLKNEIGNLETLRPPEDFAMAINTCLIMIDTSVKGNINWIRNPAGTQGFSEERLKRLLATVYDFALEWLRNEREKYTRDQTLLPIDVIESIKINGLVKKRDLEQGIGKCLFFLDESLRRWFGRITDIYLRALYEKSGHFAENFEFVRNFATRFLKFQLTTVETITASSKPKYIT